MRVGAVVVTYNPDSCVPELLDSLSAQFDHVIVVDNTPGLKQTVWPALPPHTQLLASGRNLGIAEALNIGVEHLKKNQCDWCFFFDQDSVIPNDYAAQMMAFARACGLQEKFMVAPDFVDRNSGTAAQFTRMTSGLPVTLSCAGHNHAEPLISTFAITSGYGIRPADYDVIGGFRQDFFIDFVDSEYCIRAWNLGFKVAVNCGVCISHAIGERTAHRLFGLTIKPNNHRALRRYYIFRNGTRMIMENLKNPILAGFFFARFAHEGLSMIYEQRRGKKIYAMWSGIVDGLRGKMGPCGASLASRFD